MRVQPHLLFPRMPIEGVRGAPAVIDLRLFLREIRSPLRHRLHLHIFSGLHLDKSLSGGPILDLRLPPHGSLENCRIIINRYRFSETAGESWSAVAHAVRIVELIAAHTNLPL